MFPWKTKKISSVSMKFHIEVDQLSHYQVMLKRTVLRQHIFVDLIAFRVSVLHIHTSKS